VHVSSRLAILVSCKYLEFRFVVWPMRQASVPVIRFAVWPFRFFIKVKIVIERGLYRSFGAVFGVFKENVP
jgi:hypothetical protein